MMLVTWVSVSPKLTEKRSRKGISDRAGAGSSHARWFSISLWRDPSSGTRDRRRNRLETASTY